MNKNIPIILSVLALIMSLVIYGRKPAVVGGYTAGYWDSAEGYYVDGTAIIDGSGNLDGSVTSDTGTFSSTLVVSGAFTAADTLAVTGISTFTGEVNMSNLVFGGATTTLSTTSQAVIQLTAANFCDNSLVDFDPSSCPSSASNTTLYLPTAAQLIADCITTAGDTKILTIRNIAAETSSITITASTTIELLEPSGGDVVIANNIIGTTEWAFVRCINENGAGNVACVVTSIQEAD